MSCYLLSFLSVAGMSLQPWTKAPLCKLLICIVLLLIGLQYMFSSTFHVYRHEPLFYIHNGAPHLVHPINWHNTVRNNTSNSSTAALLLMNLTANNAAPTDEILSPHNAADIPNVTSIAKNQSESRNSTVNELPLCPLIPKDLKGPVPISDVLHTMEQLEILFDNLGPGGHYSPPHCRARSRVALIIPYRDRASQLNALLYHMHPFLQKQQLEYGIIIVEQSGKLLP